MARRDPCLAGDWRPTRGVRRNLALAPSGVCRWNWPGLEGTWRAGLRARQWQSRYLDVEGRHVEMHGNARRRHALQRAVHEFRAGGSLEALKIRGELGDLRLGVRGVAQGSEARVAPSGRDRGADS